MTDLDELLPAIAAGDETSFGRFVAGAEPRLRGVLRPFAVHLDTESLLQETLLRIWQIAPRVVTDRKGDSLLRAGLVIARNLARSELRRRRVVPQEIETLERASEDAASGRADPPLGDPLLRALLARCVHALTGRLREVWLARMQAAGGTPDRDLAGELRMQLNTFLQNVGRARRQLVACLAEQGVRAEEWRP